MFDDVLKPLDLLVDLLAADLLVVSAHGEAAQGTLGSSHLLKVDESAATIGQAALRDLTILGALASQAGKHLLLRLAVCTKVGDVEDRRRKKSAVSRLWEGRGLDVEQWVGESFFCCDSTQRVLS